MTTPHSQHAGQDLAERIADALYRKEDIAWKREVRVVASLIRAELESIQKELTTAATSGDEGVKANAIMRAIRILRGDEAGG